MNQRSSPGGGGRSCIGSERNVRSSFTCRQTTMSQLPRPESTPPWRETFMDHPRPDDGEEKQQQEGPRRWPHRASGQDWGPQPAEHPECVVIRRLFSRHKATSHRSRAAGDWPRSVQRCRTGKTVVHRVRKLNGDYTFSRLLDRRRVGSLSMRSGRAPDAASGMCRDTCGTQKRRSFPPGR